jgi:predicted RNase H-like HicB family nuclease
MNLTAVIHLDSAPGRFVAECSEVGTTSQGLTKEGALSNLKEATDLYLEAFPGTVIKPPAPCK